MTGTDDHARDRHARDHAADPQQGDGRHVRYTPASTIKPRRTRWLWEGRMPEGMIALLVGREGLGKSTITWWLVSRLTKGELPGEFFGQPKSVIVAATEDGWAEVIVPRLLAAEADMARIYRVDVVTNGEGVSEVILPADIADVERSAMALDVVLLVLDPLISRLGQLDTHRDAEVRQALEPLGKAGSRAGFATLGIIHPNKGNASNLLDTIMGSRAFSAFSRSVSIVMPDPEVSARRLFGTPKNNLGGDMPTLTYSIESRFVGIDDRDQTPIYGSYVVWGEESTTTIADAHADARDGGHTLIAEAMELLRGLLDDNGGCVTTKQALSASRKAGLSDATLYRAKQRLGLKAESQGGFPRTNTWTDPTTLPAQNSHARGET